MIILGIETSCDDTGIAIIQAPHKKGVFKILSNVVSSQVKVHAKFGGVVPNLAAREHLKNIEPCLKTAFLEANIKPEQIDLIAVTVGPGLIPSLLIGTNFAKALAYKWKKPIVAVNHIEAHIAAALISSKCGISNFQFLISKTLFPAIALVVSGGHTQLVLVKKIGSPPHQKFGVGGNYKILGETRDDAAGECFDKVAKLLGLGYPGGPIVAKIATKIKNQKSKIKNIELPRPMLMHKNYDFSFSGLKTAVLYLLKDTEQKYHILSDRTKDGTKIIPELCAEVQQAIIDVLIEKTLRAAKEYKAKTIILSGGVAANAELRKQFEEKIQDTKYLPCRQAGQIRTTNFLVPPKKLCTDNGAMIAMAGYYNYKSGKSTNWRKIKANANLRIG